MTIQSATTFNPDTSVGQLVAERPSRSRVFEEFGIDYCCGGKSSLRDACGERGIDAGEVIAALVEMDARRDATDDTDWRQASLAELIANIVTTHHAYLQRELPRLTELAQKTQQAHGARHSELTEVQTVLAGLRAELESHMLKEERILFPMIEAMEVSGRIEPSHCGSVQNPIGVMEHEHESAGRALGYLRELTAGFTPPVDACNTWRALLDGLRALETDLHEHIHKENNILFPRALGLATAHARTAPAAQRS